MPKQVFMHIAKINITHYIYVHSMRIINIIITNIIITMM